MRRAIDLNGDLGEGVEGVDDALLMPLMSSCNIACGGHAGDRDSMAKTVALAVDHGVAVGAHPAYPDPQNFGRGSTDLDPGAVADQIYDQCLRLAEVADAAGIALQHVKPHGALYNDLVDDQALATAVYSAVLRLDPPVMVYGPAATHLATTAADLDLAFVHEAFADRRYETAGRLLPRSEPGSILTDPAEILVQVEALVGCSQVATVRDGTQRLPIDSLCLHGDTPGAPTLLQVVRRWLEAHDVAIRPPR